MTSTGGEIELSDEVKTMEEINMDDTYYIPIDYYIREKTPDGADGRLVQYAASCKGSDFFGENNEKYITYYDVSNRLEVDEPGEGIIVTTKVGGKRVGNITSYSHLKSQNETDTATLYYAPVYGTTADSSNYSIITYLGNNGALAVQETWLFITKTVEANVDKNHFLEAKNEEFTFDLKLIGDIANERAIVFTYIWNGTQWIPEADTTYVITDNEGYILDVDGKRTVYWVGNSYKERLVNSDGTITAYSGPEKTDGNLIRVYKDEDNTDPLFKLTVDMRIKELKFNIDNATNTATATFTLKDGEGILVSGLSAGTSYIVTEHEIQNPAFEFVSVAGREDDDFEVNERTITGITEAGLTDEANYINKFTQELVKLDLRKTVVGTTDDKERDWTFEITFTPESDIVLYDSYDYKGSSFVDDVTPALDGTIEFTQNEDGSSTGSVKLKHGQNITIDNLPKGLEYKIEEVESNKNNFTTVPSNESGNLNEDGLVEYINASSLVDFEFKKVESENQENPLNGAKFTLYRLVCKDPTHHTDEDHNMLLDSNNINECFEKVGEKLSGEDNIDGQVKFEGIILGEEYRLVEDKATLGRVKPQGQWRVVFEAGKNVPDITALGENLPPAFVVKNGVELLLPNTSIFSFPSSGAIGTSLFYKIGLSLMFVGVVILAVIKLKMKTEKQ